MNVRELHALMGDALEQGKGDWPVQVMEVAMSGVTFAVEFECCQAHPFDGERFWIVKLDDEHQPVWMTSQRKQ